MQQQNPYGASGVGGYDGPVYMQITVKLYPKDFDDWTKHFEKGLPILRKHGENLVAAWRTIFGPGSEMTAIYSFKSMAEMERIRKSLFSDPEQLKHQAINLPRVHEYATKLMVPLPYSPMETEQKGVTYDGRVFLHITIHFIPGKLTEWTRHYEKGLPTFKKHGENLVAAWRTIYGSESEVTDLYAFDSLAEMERIRRNLFADPKHLEHEKVNTPWTHDAQTKLMVPLSYSPMR